MRTSTANQNAGTHPQVRPALDPSAQTSVALRCENPNAVVAGTATARPITLGAYTFPRADDNPDALYREMYCIEAKARMQHYVATVFALAQWPRTVRGGVSMVAFTACREMGRPANANELECMRRVVRDLLNTREAQERARVLAREVL